MSVQTLDAYWMAISLTGLKMNSDLGSLSGTKASKITFYYLVLHC